MIEIVIVEDEEDILELLEYHLSSEGYNITGFLSTNYVEEFLEEEQPDLMIIDRNLPTMEGSIFVSNLRKKGINIPVIFLTAKDSDNDLEEGFNRGGDDYITKPFNTQEVKLRVKALLRRCNITPTQKIKYKDLTLNISTKELFIEKEKIDLTNLEFKLLHTFVKSPNIILDRDFLRDEVWGDDNINFHDKTINVAMNRLKKKIDPQATKNYFTPIWGVGYKLER